MTESFATHCSHFQGHCLRWLVFQPYKIALRCQGYQHCFIIVQRNIHDYFPPQTIMTLGDLDACSVSACAPATQKTDPVLTLSYSPLHLAHRPEKGTGIATSLSIWFDHCFMHALRFLGLYLISARCATMRWTIVYHSEITVLSFSFVAVA